MTTWTSDELTKIGTAEELEIESLLAFSTFCWNVDQSATSRGMIIMGSIGLAVTLLGPLNEMVQCSPVIINPGVIPFNWPAIQASPITFLKDS